MSPRDNISPAPPAILELKHNLDNLESQFAKTKEFLEEHEKKMERLEIMIYEKERSGQKLGESPMDAVVEEKVMQVFQHHRRKFESQLEAITNKSAGLPQNLSENIFKDNSLAPESEISKKEVDSLNARIRILEEEGSVKVKGRLEGIDTQIQDLEKQIQIIWSEYQHFVGNMGKGSLSPNEKIATLDSPPNYEKVSRAEDDFISPEMSVTNYQLTGVFNKE